MAAIDRDQEFWTSLIERTAQTEALLALSEAAQKLVRLSDPEAASFLGTSHSNLAHKRSEQNALAEVDRDARSIGSIPYLPGPPIQYRLYELLRYKVGEEPVAGVSNKRSQAAKEKTAKTVKENAAKREALSAKRKQEAQMATRVAFSSFLQSSTVLDTWPFSIQADGRPIDLYAAILDKKLTGRAERLTLREFGKRVADAAAAAYAEGEKTILSESIALVQDKLGSGSRQGRRAKSGGAL